MNIFTPIFFALIISMVPFSVAINSSVYRCIEWKETIRVALVFGVLSMLMTAMGWGIGYSVKGLFYDMKVPVAIIMMLFIALRLFIDSRRKGRNLRIMASEDSRILLGFGMVISINPALLGISMGMLYNGVLLFSGIVFSTVFLVTVLGIRLGKLGLVNLGRFAELFGSLALLAAGILILLQYVKMI